MKTVRRISLILTLLMLLCSCIAALAEETNLVILTTTDMHGKCWEKNILTGQNVPQNMLRVATAVREIRQAYGEENVILLDNGDLFQGTPVSEVHLLSENHPDHPDSEAEAMELCLTEIGYDALVLGNHEFDFPFDTMMRIYDRLRKSGISVLAANACYDGTDGAHTAGENVVEPYMVREVNVNGHAHKVGILGLENSDITRWDLPENYPGIIFTHPDNPEYDMGKEVNRFIPMMREEGCDMIIVSFHSGAGQDDGTPVFGVSSDNQGHHILNSTDCLDLLILGHDHVSAYSNTTVPDKAGRQVMIVNGGSYDMTKTVFRLTEDSEEKLVCELVSSENVSLPNYDPDSELEEKIRPYVEMADDMMGRPVGELSGEWDESWDFYFRKNDTLNLVFAAMMETGTKRMNAKYGKAGPESITAAPGLNHLDVDAAVMTPVNGGYIAHRGPITMRDIYHMYYFANYIMVIPMTGSELKAVMEENAAERLSARVLNGHPFFYTKNDMNTHLIFGGINFHYDMSRPAGDRVMIEGFANGRPFSPDGVYLVTVNSYILGNHLCGLRKWSTEDTLWSQVTDDAGETIYDSIQDFIVERWQRGESVTAETQNWQWSVIWSGDPADQKASDGQAAARLAAAPQDGHRYVLYHEAQGSTLTGMEKDGVVTAVEITACGNDLLAPLPEDALIFTVQMAGDDTLRLMDQSGRYLCCGLMGNLMFQDEDAGQKDSLWQLIPAESGFYLKSADSTENYALQYYGGRFCAFRLSSGGWYLFNFYEVTEP